MFTLPLFDDSPTRRPAVLIWLIIVVCAVVFLWQSGQSAPLQRRIIYGLGAIPAVLAGEASLPRNLYLVPGWLTLFTSQFVHGGWLHLIGNMWFLWIFGDNVEDAMSRPRFLAFYLACGAVAVIAQSAAAPGSQVPMVGASGAIAGILGAYVVLHPRANVTVLFVIIFFIRFVRLPAVLVLGLWFVIQLASGAMTPTGEGGIAFWAHSAGFLAGMALIPLFKDRDVPLLAGPYSRVFSVTRMRDYRRGSVPDSGAWHGGRRRGPWG